VTAHISFLAKFPEILATVSGIKFVETKHHGGVKNGSRSCHHIAPHTNQFGCGERSSSTTPAVRYPA
jgi:hypothetical protein